MANDKSAIRSLQLVICMLICLVSVTGRLTIVVAQDQTPTLPPRPTIEPTLPPRPTIGPTLPPRPTIGPTLPPRPTLEPTSTPVRPPSPETPSPPEVLPTPEPTIILPITGSLRPMSSIALLALGLGVLVIVAGIALRRNNAYLD